MRQRESSSLLRRGRFLGFSAIELVVVILLVGILAVFAAPRWIGTQVLTLPATTAQLAANIRYTQSLAMSQGQRYRINLTATTYQITDMVGGSVLQPVVGGTAPVTIAGVTLTGFNPPLTNNYVAFDTKGVPYISATAVLAGAATITLTAGAETGSIVIAPETGRVQ